MTTPSRTYNDPTSVRLGIGPTFSNDEIFTHDVEEAVGVGTILAKRSTDQKLVVFAPGGADGTGEPYAVLNQEIESDGASDYPVRPFVRGAVVREKLVIHAQGESTVIDSEIIGLFIKHSQLWPESAPQLQPFETPHVDSI